ncbi:DNA binding domain, excisionase family [Calidithermus terrae]|uniref:DNA binding domain, excisionase family n=1 Tax=Calidithermus terrae TaxID=1408545 RepID=A0A399F8A9_9DEIN|nr:helix-turn-helix domain-containing protein [Calidithermus terrae]RIH90871.1 DNA binding domain, excisionase family [Calidithermus terrae]
MEKLAYNVQEVAALLGIHRNTVRKLIQRGDIPAMRLGHRILVPRAKLEALLDAKQNPAGAGGA